MLSDERRGEDVEAPASFFASPNEACGELEHVLTMLRQYEPSIESADDPELLGFADKALGALTFLWRHCEALSEPEDAAHRENVAIQARRLSAKIAPEYARPLRMIEGRLPIQPPPSWAASLVRLMCFVRWAARWAWLGYERVSPELWALAAYTYETAEHAQALTTLTTPGDDARPTSIEQEYLSLLFAQWISPFALSPAAYCLVERLIEACREDLSLSPMTVREDDEIVNLDTGHVVLEREALTHQRKQRLRYAPLTRMRERMSAALETTTPVETDVHDVLEQISRTVIGRQRRKLVRLGERTQVVRSVRAIFGYGKLLAGAAAGAADVTDPDQLCMLRDRSTQGCRLLVPAQPLNIGMLARVTGIFESETSLGVVRWLTRADNGQWEVGLQLIRGAISLLIAQPANGNWPSSQHGAPIFVIDTEEWEPHALVAVLPKSTGNADITADLVLPDAQLRLRRQRYMETGVDFDLSLFSVDELF
jgi:hypothetical protein